mgnify:CR=1 FL=1
MGYLAVWKTLEDIVSEFRGKGISIPANIMSDLRYARSLINVLRADPKRRDTAQKIEEYLENLEAYLVSEGQKHFDAEQVEGWLKRLDKARREVSEEVEETRFVPGLPKEQKWIRVKPSAELSIEKLKTLAGELNLSYNLQSDGYLLVYGEDKRVKDFVKKMATIYGSKVKK